MTNSCAWCQKDISSITDKWNGSKEEYISFCPDCLIEILPKALHPKDPKNEETDNRISQRYPLISEVYLLSQKEKKTVTQVVIQNISDTGMKIILKESFVAGERITIGVIGELVVYKAIMMVVYVNPVKGAKIDCFEMGAHLIGIHQELK